MPIEIRETKIATGGASSVVELQISDVALDEKGGAFLLSLSTTLPVYEVPFLAQVQREAILKTIGVLREIEGKLLQELPEQIQGETFCHPKTK